MVGAGTRTPMESPALRAVASRDGAPPKRRA
jgi:hypothetical protein